MSYGVAVVNAYGAIVLSIGGLMAVGQIAAWNSRDNARLAAEASSTAADPAIEEERLRQWARDWDRQRAAETVQENSKAILREWNERQAAQKAQEDFDKSPQGLMMAKILRAVR
jgi:hypothetical protein